MCLSTTLREYLLGVPKSDFENWVSYKQVFTIVPFMQNLEVVSLF